LTPTAASSGLVWQQTCPPSRISGWATESTLETVEREDAAEEDEE
jgi:hypothetical protein